MEGRDDRDDPDDGDELAGYVDVWWQAVGSFTALLDDLLAEGADDDPDADPWSRATDLPGWTVHDVVAHTAHLESVLAGAAQPTGAPAVAIGSPEHVRSPMGVYTETGVAARRATPPSGLLDELRAATTSRHRRLTADPPTDATARPDPTFPGVPWDWRTLLRNRPLDVWMHEQDVRRAVGRPGGLTDDAADHTEAYLLQGLGFVVGKRVAPPAGTVVVLDVDGAPSAVTVGDDGRAHRLPAAPADPTVRLTMTREVFLLLAGGRQAQAADSVRVDGDVELGRRVLGALATTP